jgi:CBS-domain-containing membrane protein
MLLLQDVLLKAAIVVAVASTACIILIVPDSLAASPRKVVGGHAVGVIVGSFFSAILMIPSVEMAVERFRIVLGVIAALSVGISILGMVATNTEHPPAAGTALGLVVHGWSISAVVFIISGAPALSVVRVILRPRLVNLL